MKLMAVVSHCLRHPERPAVARCRSCGRSFCRECVVEHGRRLVCADCLRKESSPAPAAARRFAWASVVQWVVAAAVLWLVFYGLASALGAGSPRRGNRVAVPSGNPSN